MSFNPLNYNKCTEYPTLKSKNLILSSREDGVIGIGPAFLFGPEMGSSAPYFTGKSGVLVRIFSVFPLIALGFGQWGVVEIFAEMLVRSKMRCTFAVSHRLNLKI